jgi:hypothetical protein
MLYPPKAVTQILDTSESDRAIRQRVRKGGCCEDEACSEVGVPCRPLTFLRSAAAAMFFPGSPTLTHAGESE